MNEWMKRFGCIVRLFYLLMLLLLLLLMIMLLLLLQPLRIFGFEFEECICLSRFWLFIEFTFGLSDYYLRISARCMNLLFIFCSVHTLSHRLATIFFLSRYCCCCCFEFLLVSVVFVCMFVIRAREKVKYYEIECARDRAVSHFFSVCIHKNK